MDRGQYEVGALDTLGLFPPDRWYAEALAYLDSSAELFGRMVTGQFDATWPRAKAGAFLFSHGLELFLKASLAQAGEKFLWGHDLERLQTLYEQRMPGSDFVLKSNVSLFVRQNAPIPFYDFLKYPERVEKINKSWPAAICVDVSEWHRNTSLTAVEARRVWPLIQLHYPFDPARWQGKVDGHFEKRPRKSERS